LEKGQDQLLSSQHLGRSYPEVLEIESLFWLKLAFGLE
jgi:hypothetical protein